MISLFIILAVAYLIGAFPTSIIVGKLLRGIDIRNFGSGNAGGTNVFRVLGWKPGVSVMAFDIFKGIAATLLAPTLQIGTAPPLDPTLIKILAGCAAVLGHIWTIFAGFRGGKGVGTAAGMILALFPIAGLICLAVFFIVLGLSRYVSVSSMAAALTLPIVLLTFHFLGRAINWYLFIFGTCLALLIIFTHRSNIKRLINHTENRVNFKKKS